MINLQKPELLSPAGDMERLMYAIEYGADAVYLGLDKYGMRTACKNFSQEDLTNAIQYAHTRGKKVYITLNSVPDNSEIAQLPNEVRIAVKAGADAFIVADLGVLAICKNYGPEVDVHFSTQVGIANYMAANMAYDMGAKRVVLARELSLNDIAFIRDNTPPQLELEAFVHGAMCMSFSGRCLLSHYMKGRDANKGECAQPCRWKYTLNNVESGLGGYEIGEDEDKSAYILNADDLCTAPFIDKIISAGIDSLKIEGRAKSFYYVASVTAAYRNAIDQALLSPNEFLCPEFVLDELTKTSHRHYSTGFYFGKEGAVQNTKFGGYIRDWDVMGVVEDCNDGIVTCTQRGKFNKGDTLEALTPDAKTHTFVADFIWDKNNEEIDSTAHAMMEFKIPCKINLPVRSIIRKKAIKDVIAQDNMPESI